MRAVDGPAKIGCRIQPVPDKLSRPQIAGNTIHLLDRMIFWGKCDAIRRESLNMKVSQSLQAGSARYPDRRQRPCRSFECPMDGPSGASGLACSRTLGCASGDGRLAGLRTGRQPAEERGIAKSRRRARALFMPDSARVAREGSRNSGPPKMTRPRLATGSCRRRCLSRSCGQLNLRRRVTPESNQPQAQECQRTGCRNLAFLGSRYGIGHAQQDAADADAERLVDGEERGSAGHASRSPGLRCR